MPQASIPLLGALVLVGAAGIALAAEPPGSTPAAGGTTAPPSAAAPAAAGAETPAPMRRASGEFVVQMTPAGEDGAPGSTLGRRTLAKTFRGEFEGEGRGEMLTVLTDTPGSATYVAVERVTGRIGDREGSFALVHRGTMARGAQVLEITIVPDSGAGGFAGIEGRLTIKIRERRHYYTLDYRLPGE